MKRSIFIILLIVFTIVICMFLFLPPVSKIMAWKSFSKDPESPLNSMPIKREIKINKSLQSKNTVELNYISFDVAWENIWKHKSELSQISSGINHLITIRNKKNEKQGLVLYKWEKCLHSKISNDTMCFQNHTFEKFKQMLSITPEQLSVFDSKARSNEKLSLLIEKTFIIPSKNKTIYKYSSEKINGFQIGIPSKNDIVKNFIFDNFDNLYEIDFHSMTQEEIDFVLASVRFGKG